MHYDAVVIGGGISGLAAAETLARRGIRVLLIEAGPSVGGAMRSEALSSGFLLEHGPNTVTSNEPALWRHFADLGIADELVTADRSGTRRYVLLNGRPEPIPTSPAAFLRSPLLSPRAKLRLLAEPLLPRSNGRESVAAFFGRRLGPEPLQRLIDPFVSGVYAGDPQTLSMQAAFPGLWAAEQRAGSLLLGMLTAPRPKRSKGQPRSRRKLFSFRNGLATWPQAIARFLGPERLWTRARALDLRPTDGEWHVTVQRDGVVTHLLVSQVILATPAPVTAQLVDRLDTNAAAALRAIHYPPVTLVHLGYRRADVTHPLDGFGLLCPSLEDAKVLGTLWPSSLFPNRAPEDAVLTTSFVGGARSPALTNQSEEALKAMVHAEQERLIGVKGEPILARVVRWPQAIPQYTAGHNRRIAALEQLEAHRSGLRLIGNYRGGISVEACWRNGHAVGEQISSTVGNEPAAFSKR